MHWLLILDVLIYNYTSYCSYFFLLIPLFCDQKDYFEIIIIGLIIDLILLKLPFLNTLILIVIFFLNKKIFKLKVRSLKNYLLISNLNFFIYHLVVSLIYGFNIIKFSTFFTIYIAFCIFSYNLFRKNIKLAR